MPRYVALLRGVSPMNANMAELRACFEAAGCTNVRTLLSSGNVVFDARRAAEATLLKRLQQAMAAHLPQAFYTLLREQQQLQELLAADPFAAAGLAPGSKRVVTFLESVPDPAPALPLEWKEVRVLTLRGREALTAYVPQPGQPAFMQLIEKLFGTRQTTRTWETVSKCAQA